MIRPLQAFFLMCALVFAFVSGYSFGLADGREESVQECLEVETPDCDSSAKDALLQAQLLQCEKDHRVVLDELLERSRTEARALKSWAACCMVDEMYPKPCTDPLCPSAP